MGIDLTEAIKSYTEDKISMIDSTFNLDNAIADVEIGKTTSHHKSGEVFRAEINLDIPGKKLIREVVVHEDLYAAIDLAKDTILNSIKNESNKQNTLFLKGARKIKDFIRGFRK